MKTRTVLLFCAALLSLQGFAQFTWLNPKPQGNALYNIVFSDSLTGYACGGYGPLIKTTDGGSSWFVLQPWGPGYYEDMTFINPQTGFTTGTSGIRKTTDGGITWTTTTFPSGLAPNQIQFVDPLHGFAACQGAFYVTSDCGESWQTRTAPGVYPFDIFFTDTLHGVISNYSLTKKTSDGGITWISNTTGDIPVSIKSMWFFNPSDGIGVGGDGNIYSTCTGATGWTHLMSPTTKNLTDIWFVNADTGYISGTYFFLKTVDKGQTWQICDTVYSNYNSLVFTSAGKGFAVGDYGEIVKKEANSEQWNVSNAITLGNMNNVYFPDARVGFVTDDTEVLRTQDYGNSWQLLTLPAGRAAGGVYFFDSLTGFVGSNAGYVLKTMDGGDSWQCIQTGLTNSYIIWHVVFINPDTGFVSGDQNVMRTTDAGNTWNQVNSVPSPMAGINSFSFPYPETGYACSLYGIWKTKNGGVNWNCIYTTNECYGVSFLDSLNGFYVNHDPGLMKTTDGGITWAPVNIPIIDPHAIQFVDKNNGFITSWCGVIKTSDGGETFQHLPSCTMNTINNSYFLDADTGYVVGEVGMILKISNAGIFTGTPQNNSVKNSLQIYPNPASAYVTVKIPENKYGVTISILDLTGRTVLSSLIPPSVVQKRIDVRQLKPGCYLLKAGSGSQPSIGKLIIQ